MCHGQSQISMKKATAGTRPPLSSSVPHSTSTTTTSHTTLSPPALLVSLLKHFKQNFSNGFFPKKREKCFINTEIW